MKKRLLLTLFAAAALTAGAQTPADADDISGSLPAGAPNALSTKADADATTASAYAWRQPSALYVYDATLEKGIIVLPAQVDDAGQPTGCGKATFNAEYTGDKAYWTYATAASADADPAADTLDVASDDDKALTVTLFDGQFAAGPTLFAIAGTDTATHLKADLATAGYDASQSGLAFDGKGQGLTNFNADISKNSSNYYAYTLGSSRDAMAAAYNYDSISPKGFGEYFNLQGNPMVLPAVKVWAYGNSNAAPATSSLQVSIYTRANSDDDWQLQAIMPCSAVDTYTNAKGTFRGYWLTFSAPTPADDATDENIALADTALLLDGVTEMLVAVENPNGDELNCSAMGSVGVQELQDGNYGYYHFECYKDGAKTDNGYQKFNLDFSSKGHIAIGYWIALNANTTAKAIADAKLITGIANPVAAPAKRESQTIYDLQGRRLNQMQRGINIVGGKKVVK